MLIITDEDINQLEKEMNLIFDLPRRNALKSFDDVQACPGSGKTTLVAAKLILLAKKWSPKYSGICVLSHTNVAKDEIINRVAKHPQGVKLLGYPHFIGTIQEFINKYLAIPYLRGLNIKVSEVVSDEDYTLELMKLKWRNFTAKDNTGTFNFLYFVNKKQIQLKDLQFEFTDSKLIINPHFISLAESKFHSTQSELLTYFISKRKEMRNKGIFTYREMYHIAMASLYQNENLTEAIQSRFHIALIDEMQDTQKFQDDLLNQLFLNHKCSLQRFGDPDQAIFDDEVNETYNNKTLDMITTSHRFNTDIANLAKGLSFKRLPLNSQRTPNNPSKPHTIFLVDDYCLSAAIPAFSELCDVHISEQEKLSFPIKAVGGIGKSNGKTESLTIGSYFDAYDKNITVNSFKPKLLIHYFSSANLADHIDNRVAYKRALEGFSRCLRLANVQLVMESGLSQISTASVLKRWLYENKKIKLFNVLIFKIQTKAISSKQLWDENCAIALDLMGVTTSHSALQSFVIFDSEVDNIQNSEIIAFPNSFKSCNSSVNVQIATIHSVKGETHAATLVLETKYKTSYDVHHVLEYLLQVELNTPDRPFKIKFMKQLYVATTRPTTLLCFAVDKNRFNQNKIHKTLNNTELAEALGWKVVDLCIPANNST